MQLSFEPLTLKLRRPFNIAHGTSHTRQNVLVRIDGGIGEAAAVPYYGETADGIAAYLSALDFRAVADPFEIEDLVAALPPGSPAARAAVDIALHDLWGQALDQPLYRLFGLNPNRIPATSFTLAMDTPRAMAEAAAAASETSLKIKLGAGDDAARIASVRAATRAPLRADANGGWTREQALRLLPLLAEHGFELIEQPLPAGDVDGLRALAELRSRPPIFVDESIATSADIVAHRGLVDGVVVKLAKCGGIRAALRQIAVAAACDMDVMLGCMVESSVAVTAAAHLAPLAKYVDLDGPLLIDNDPLRGVEYRGGRLVLPAGPGLGLCSRDVN
ncbi:MAG TPA: dipeptide epimerase [Polyangiaceae bacterium]|nr:dipeptide epimerase [Polyangiaceae bacterium]